MILKIFKFKIMLQALLFQKMILMLLRINVSPKLVKVKSLLVTNVRNVKSKTFSGLTRYHKLKRNKINKLKKIFKELQILNNLQILIQIYNFYLIKLIKVNKTSLKLNKFRKVEVNNNHNLYKQVLEEGEVVKFKIIKMYKVLKIVTKALNIPSWTLIIL